MTTHPIPRLRNIKSKSDFVNMGLQRRKVPGDY